MSDLSQRLRGFSREHCGCIRSGAGATCREHEEYGIGSWCDACLHSEAADALDALARERDELILERDSAREQFDKHVEWASARCARLEAALREALSEWEYASGYKGEHLQQKHGDLSRIAELRAELAPEGTPEPK